MSPFVKLDVAVLTRALGAKACRFDIDLLPQCDSTNAVLLERAEHAAPSGTVVMAEQQTAGRGRRGRSWHSSAGDSLTFSLLWRFAPGCSPAGLSLAVGLAVVRALQNHQTQELVEIPGGDAAVSPKGAGFGASPLQLKWPNDILKNGGKLGGILIELVPGTPHAAVIGIGLNLHLPVSMPEPIRANAAALGDCDPNALAALVLAELADVLDGFALGGFAPFRADWQRRDAFSDRPVRLLSEFAPSREGICRGVDDEGALRLEVDGQIQPVISGEVSLRPMP